MTERKSTGNSPLLDMLKEVYDTKLRMKKVINMVLDSNSDDFEEYSTLAYNALVTKYNEGIRDGYNDGYHSLFPDVQLSEEDWSEFYKEFRNFAPSVPTYTTGTDIDNLTVLMTDSLRCRLLLKAVLETNSNEFVTYPDILESLYESWYQEAYDFAWDEGYADALEHYYEPAAPTVEQDNNTVVITNNEPDGVIYYSFDMGTTWTEYVAPFTIDDTCMILVKCDVTEAHPYWRPGVTTVSYTTTYYLNYAPTVTLDESTFTFTVTNNDPNTKGTLWYKINNGSWVEYTGETNFDMFTDYVYGKYTYNGQTSPIGTAGTDYGLEVIFPNGNGTLELNNDYSGLTGEYKLNNDNWTSWSAANGDSRTFTNVDRIILRNFNRELSYITGNDSKHRAFNTDSRYNVRGYLRRVYNGTDSQWSPYPPEYRCFFGMNGDYNNLNIVDASQLILPENGNFWSMFEACTNLTAAPQNIPAGSSCYSMFWYCTSLVSGPQHVYTSGSCERMFGRCYALTTAPYLHSLSPTNYNHMFYECTALTTAPTIDATSLTDYCCQFMFYGCTALTTAPELHAETIPDYGYRRMFEGCTSLVNIPDLPIRNVGNYSCYKMFYGCTSIITSPSMEVNTVSDYSFYAMFYGCTSLTTAKAIFLKNSSNNYGKSIDMSQSYRCCEQMYKGCILLTTAPELTSMNLGSNCYMSMFEDCSSLTTAPDLLATQPVTECYQQMFSGCTVLNYVKCLLSQADVSQTNYTANWLSNASSTGTFVKKQNVEWRRDSSGIPSGWTVQEAA